MTARQAQHDDLLRLPFGVGGRYLRPVRIGLIKEGKQPPDTRVVLTPWQAAELVGLGIEVWVQPSPHRSFRDEVYADLGITVTDAMDQCDILLGIKEVPITWLIPDKTYFFFSHTIKGQPHNMPLLKAILDKRITLIDFECLTDENGNRVIAFGRWAGIVGAYNGLMTYGQRLGTFHFPRIDAFRDFEEVQAFLHSMKLPPIRIAVTGTGRVAGGVLEILQACHVRPVDSETFLNASLQVPVFVQLGSRDLYRRRSDGGFDREEFHKSPRLYESTFAPFLCADLLMNAMFWDARAPRLFELETMSSPAFRIKTIADITCDVHGSVPATIRASTISEPVYGFDPVSKKEVPPYQPHCIDIMGVDNLPNELPRDASQDFGEVFLKDVLPELRKPQSRMLGEATIAAGGELTERYSYLKEFLH